MRHLLSKVSHRLAATSAQSVVTIGLYGLALVVLGFPAIAGWLLGATRRPWLALSLGTACCIVAAIGYDLWWIRPAYSQAETTPSEIMDVALGRNRTLQETAMWAFAISAVLALWAGGLFTVGRRSTSLNSALHLGLGAGAVAILSLAVTAASYANIRTADNLAALGVHAFQAAREIALEQDPASREDLASMKGLALLIRGMAATPPDYLSDIDKFRTWKTNDKAASIAVIKP